MAHTPWDESEETVVTGTQEEYSNLKYGVLAGVLAAAAAVCGVILYRIRSERFPSHSGVSGEMYPAENGVNGSCMG